MVETELFVKIQRVVRWEYFWAVLVLAGSSWTFYKTALSRVSNDRHQIFKRQFKGLWTRVGFVIVGFSAHKVLLSYRELAPEADNILPGSGLLAIFLGAALAIKTFKIIVFESFFFSSMKEGVPLLLVDVCSLILSILILSWSLTGLFDVQLSSLVATSAVLTIVLGLALQDTLGNLFAAISLQIDKPFELDDWIEVKSGVEKIAGQVKELSWRATVLLAVTDEFVTIPNRMLAQWQITNFSGKQRPFYRGYFFRIPFGESVEEAKEALLDAAKSVPDILTAPEPIVIILETAESWVTLKAVYAIKDYGAQYVIADKFHSKALNVLSRRGIHLAVPKISLET